MKKLIVIALFLSVLGCQKKKEEPLNLNYTLATIKTSFDKESATILLYDSDLNEVGQLYLPYAELGVGRLFKMGRNGNSISVIPFGKNHEYDTRKVLELDTQTLGVKVFDLDRNNIVMSAISEKYIYAGSNLNSVSYLSQLNRETGEVKEIEYDMYQMVSHIYACEGSVIVFRIHLMYQDEQRGVNTARPELLFYDEALNLLHSLDLSNYGSNLLNAAFVGHDLYVPLQSELYTDNQIEQAPSSEILKINTDTYETRAIDIGVKGSKQVEYYNGKLYVLSATIPNIKESYLTVVDPLTESIEEQIDLGHQIDQFEINQDALYASGENEELFKFSILDGFELVKSIQLKATDDEFYPTMFLKNSED